MPEQYDVIVAGAGPVGLFLACELALAGTSVLVVERDAKPDSAWKTLPLGRRGLNTVSVEALYRRGLLGKIDPSDRPSTIQRTAGKFQFGGHFAGIGLNANKLELDRWRYRLPGPSLVPTPTSLDALETTFGERAAALGVTIVRGAGIDQIISETASEITVGTTNGQRYIAQWLVGCDGGRSAVRKLAGFDFVGTDPRFTGYISQVELDHLEKLKPGFNVTKKGMYIVAPGNSLYLMDFDHALFDRTQEITVAHLQDVLDRVTEKSDVKITNIVLAGSFTDRSKQATQYRRGRVLLAGDAAHIHSPLGAQGLNVGLGDAVNLGWKLAATVRREQDASGANVDLALLDTYEKERHPIGAWVLEWTRVQVAALQPDLFGQAVFRLLGDLIDTTDGTNLFLDRVWGLSQRYELGDGAQHAHELVGASAPDFELADGSRLGAKLEGGKGILVDFEDNAQLKELCEDNAHGAKVQYLATSAEKELGLRALLVRPDGIVAWVAERDSETDLGAAKDALTKWFS